MRHNTSPNFRDRVLSFRPVEGMNGNRGLKVISLDISSFDEEHFILLLGTNKVHSQKLSWRKYGSNSCHFDPCENENR
jgi:hypothetical protein